MDMLQVVVEPRRREILRLLWDRELSVGEVASRFPVSLAAVSLHLGVLRKAGLVTVRPDGKRRMYRANRDALARLAPMLEAMWRQDLDRLAAAAEADETTGEAGQQ
ncbi:MAG: ArsR/SmtB family transcription factor [Nocardioidaceae bacterium]